MTSPRTVKITELPASTQDLNDTDSFVAVQPFGSSLLTVKMPASKILDAARIAGASAANVTGLTFETVAEAQSSLLPPLRETGSFLKTFGYTVVGDDGGAIYQKVTSEPSVPGKFQDRSGFWWKLVSYVLTPEMFGAVADGITDDTVSVQAAITQGQLENKPVRLSKKTYGLTNITFAQPVGTSVYPPILIGIPGGNDNTFSVIKRLVGGDTTYTLAPYGWVNDNPQYFGGGFFQDFTIDNDDIGYHAFVNCMSASVTLRVNVVNCLGDGFLVPLSTKAGTDLQGALSQMKFIECRGKNCSGAGIRIMPPTTSFCSDGEIVDCNFSECEEYCMDVRSSAGFTISGNRMFNYLRGAPFAGTALSRINTGKSTRISDNVFGGDGISAAPYNLELNVSFFPAMVSYNSFDGAGAGMLVNFVNTGNNGLCRVTNNFFVSKGAAGQPQIVHGTDDGNAVIVASGNVFQIDGTVEPYAWAAGNTLGVVNAIFDSRQDGAGVGGKTFFNGVQQPTATQTFVFGVKVLQDSDGTYSVDETTPGAILRNAAMTADQDIILPEFPADGEEFKITRGRDASGEFNLNVKRFSGSLVVALASAQTSAVVKYSKTFTDWYSVSRSSWRASDAIQYISGTANYNILSTTARKVFRTQAMTADQTVLLPSSPVNGDTYQLIRAAGATGAFNFILARSDASTLYTLTVEKSSVTVVYSKTAADWIVTTVATW